MQELGVIHTNKDEISECLSYRLCVQFSGTIFNFNLILTLFNVLNGLFYRILGS
jgi:hypothetical protein